MSIQIKLYGDLREKFQHETYEVGAPITINIEDVGKNRVIFELYTLNRTSLEYEYTETWVSLSVEALESQ